MENFKDMKKTLNHLEFKMKNFQDKMEDVQ